MKSCAILSAGLAIICFPFSSLTAQSGDLYRWVDQSGVVHYGDVPTADSEKIGSRISSGEVGPNGNLSYAARRAAKDFPVTLYVGSNCVESCEQARSLLHKRGIPFTETMLRSREEIDAFKRMTGSEVVPTLAVGKSVSKGFQAGQWQEELDIAGYPKLAPYRAPEIQTIAPSPAIPAPAEINTTQ